MDVGWVKGAAIAVRADVFSRLGGFRAVEYGQEADLAYRTSRQGAIVRFDPSAEVMHIGNFSAGQRWTQAERARKVASAELMFLQTHYGRLRRSAIRLITGAAYAGRAAAHAVLLRRERADIYRAMARVYMTPRRRAIGARSRAARATSGR
jgi:GT2 family glycosyltransferase